MHGPIGGIGGAAARALPLCVAALYALAPVAGAAEVAPGSGCSRPLTIAISPLGRSMMISPAGVVGGIVRDVFDKVAARSGCQIDYVVMPRARAHAMFKAGQVDIIAAATKSAERDASGDFVQTHGVRAMLVSLRGRDLSPMTIAALLSGDLRVDTLRGYYFGAAYAALTESPAFRHRVDVSPDPATVVRKLVAGRTDVALLAPAVLIDAAEQEGILQSLRVTELVGMDAVPSGVYLGKSLTPADLRKIRLSITSLVRSGEYEKIFRSHYAFPWWAGAGIEFPGAGHSGP